MNAHAWLVLAAYGALLLAAALPLGRCLVAVMEGRLRFADHIEQPLYRLCGIRPGAEMGWLQYAFAILLFNALGVLAVYALQRLQQWLPLNPQGMANVTPDSAFNTAVSFATNTNWQGYSGEQTMSYLTQMLGLAVQNFLSAATGIVVVIALIRGLARHSAQGIGNAWVDLTRVTLWVLLPLSFVLALLLVQQGTVQNFDGYKDVRTVEALTYQQPRLGPDGQPMKDAQGAPLLEDRKAETQTLAMGPAASQTAIKMLGTNGGGFFNANAAHPYENPTALSNLVQMLSIFLIPAALCFAFGRMVQDRRQGWTVFVAMSLLFVAGAVAAIAFEQQGNPQLAALGVDQSAAAGLMIGRTPEYLGKKIEAHEMKMTSLAILVTPLVVLLGTALAVMADAGRAGPLNGGAHGFSEILYAFTSAGNNNGSAFAGLSANTPFYNVVLGVAMWFGRFGVIVPVLAIAAKRPNHIATASSAL